MRKGALSAVSFVSQFRSIPSVTERKITASQTTSEITRTDINAMRETESCRLRGMRYLRAMDSSNMLYFASLKMTRFFRLLSYFFSSSLFVDVLLFFDVQ